MVIIIPLLTVLFWIKPLFSIPTPITEATHMPLFAILAKILPYGSIGSKIFGYIFLVAIALLISRLNTKFILIPERSYLPTLIYILLISSIISETNILAIAPATVLFLFAYERILDSYRLERLCYNPFDATLLLGIASLFYFHFAFVILFIWSALSSVRSFRLREWLFTFIGFGLPYFILMSIYYLTNTNPEVLYSAIKANIFIDYNITFTKAQYIFLAYCFLLLIIASQKSLILSAGKKILARKSFNLQFFLFLLTIGLFVSLKSASTELLYLAAFPVSMVLSDYFISARHTRWVEILFDLMIVTSILAMLVKF